jgi:4,5-DOPA dioxygenase extradiol
MSDPVLPSIFVSHGAPTLALDPGAAGAFWERLAKDLPQPRGILAISAHWTTAEPMLTGTAKPDTIHDFYGFPEPLYRIFYCPPGAPALAERAQALLAASDLPSSLELNRGLDHGAWVPLKSMYPAADVPVVELSVQPQRDAAWHLRLGRALAPLREEGVLILGSGGAVHNLREVAWNGGAPPDWAHDFDEWLAATLAAGREQDILDWQRRAPQANRAQPTPEHFMPLFVALGAAGPGARGERLYQGFTLGSLSMAAFRFAA